MKFFLPNACLAAQRQRRILCCITAAFFFLSWNIFLPALCVAAQGPGPESAKTTNERGQILSPQSIIGKVNSGGPEDWPEQGGLSTAGSVSPASTSSSGGSGRQGAAPAANDLPKADVRPDAPKASTGQRAATSSPSADTDPDKKLGKNTGGAVSKEQSGLPLGPAKPESKAEPPAPPREVIYVDEKGNPVPKPVDPAKLYADAEKLISENKFAEALAELENIRNLPGLSRELLEKILYSISDCVWARYADNPLAGYEPIVKATNEAMNANLRSPRVPDALLRLALANANVGNLGEAQGYMQALMRRFPDYPGVAQGFTVLGQKQLEHGLDAEAERSFAVVLDKYPESNLLQNASVGLAKALVKLKKHEQAQVILDFISKRWPRYYIGDPDFLLMQAANDEKTNQLDNALDLYWLYLNLDPLRNGNDALMLKMGDDYLRRGKPEAANFIYEEIVGKFPDSPAAITARLRLAEKGIYDTPLDYEKMRDLFARSSQQPLWKVYSDLAESSQSNPEAVLARLKQAMWLFWDKQYPEAMGKAAEFIDAYPEHRDAAAARELLWQAFQKELANSMAEQNYGRILLLWNGFPMVRERYGEPDAALRYALAQGWLERGEQGKSFELLADFLKGPMDPKFGEATFTQFFNHYLKNGAWEQILDLGKLVAHWPMNSDLRKQLDYAEALSAQNLNLGAPALEMWKKLAVRNDIPLYQQAYATYFLARDAEARKDIKAAYENNRKVIELFGRLQDERSDKADPERIKEATAALMDICEVGNRIPEALEWVERFSAYVPENSPEYPGLRFREARLYRKLGDNMRAIALLENLVNRFPDSPFAKAAESELRTFEVSRDLQRFMPGGQTKAKSAPSGSTEGNWSSTSGSDKTKKQ